MIRNTRFVFFVFIIFIISLLFFQCGKSEEELIIDAVELMGDYAEERNIDGVLGFISTDYSDDEERIYEDIVELLNKYFDRYRGIAVNILATKIIKIDTTRAEIETELALSSGASKLFRKAVRYSGECYRFNLSLVKEEKKWRCKYARWVVIPIEELFPESIKIIKKLFPTIL
jgi:hypothetical protein